MIIKVAFYKGKGTFFNYCIRFLTCSIYSHVEIVFFNEGGKGISLISSSQRDGGVRYKKMQRADFKYKNWTLIDAPKELLIQDLHQFFMDREKYKYDFKGIFLSQFLPLKRHSKRRYFCSEFCAEVLGLSDPHIYSPQGLYAALTKNY
ncbi:MAG: hypothetical protein AAFZ92_07540 [Pseudomonadota bacterium]